MCTTTASSVPDADAKEDIENIDADVKKKYQQTAKHDLYPFKLRWSFGINPGVPMINLTTDNRTLLAYACSHVVMMYDYSSKTVSPLQGHVGIRIPHGSEGMTAARISPNAKYIVTVGSEKCQNVYFWLWTYSKDQPNASVSLIDTMSERVKEVTFNDEYPEQFALTTDYHVLFLTWDGDALSYDCPKIATKLQRIGIFNGSCYVSKIQQVFTATANGCILVWGNVSPEEEREANNSNYRKKKKKKHIKTVNLQKCNITVIIDNQRYHL
ncbi:WD repeat-containing protein 66 [Harpegnathos saltator]|uniref:WD repeat-containing protein 66 n=1 Tax=Harpegnathos saltator TaxID=610380 RepID=E2BEC4_HARSA|nr:WD repeat-containing protein 66 [Harpegnathos saltator]